MFKIYFIYLKGLANKGLYGDNCLTSHDCVSSLCDPISFKCSKNKFSVYYYFSVLFISFWTLASICKTNSDCPNNYCSKTENVCSKWNELKHNFEKYIFKYIYKIQLYFKVQAPPGFPCKLNSDCSTNVCNLSKKYCGIFRIQSEENQHFYHLYFIIINNIFLRI